MALKVQKPTILLVIKVLETKLYIQIKLHFFCDTFFCDYEGKRIDQDSAVTVKF